MEKTTRRLGDSLCKTHYLLKDWYLKYTKNA